MNRKQRSLEVLSEETRMRKAAIRTDLLCIFAPLSSRSCLRHKNPVDEVARGEMPYEPFEKGVLMIRDGADAARRSCTPEKKLEMAVNIHAFCVTLERFMLEPLAVEEETDVIPLLLEETCRFKYAGESSMSMDAALGRAREYQSFAAQMLEIKRGLLLADDVGIGKTVTAICSMTLPDNLPAVVVCPAHMPPQWAAMLARFAPGLSVHVLKKGTPYPLTRGIRRGQLELLDDRLPDVIISNYHKLRGWAETLAGFRNVWPVIRE